MRAIPPWVEALTNYVRDGGSRRQQVDLVVGRDCAVARLSRLALRRLGADDVDHDVLCDRVDVATRLHKPAGGHSTVGRRCA
jgi:hypothetical protein